ncbi:Fasciclin-like arabinogalactan protein 8 [Dichanthelium oligosanthes]|uniref:Fasciclin-like arabinogalactan protein 8 n=1 Tax=Dichanthelium oligosanthes TaxID=888268 RepID=A0A1E5WJS4_9POAL|nr:Fasciclin-like arabinogalactan protein 8 [Dichanthelium oligosanthes]
MAASPVRGRNITAILDGYKEYKLYNQYLSETKVCDEINSRQSTSMTILVLSKDAMTTLAKDAGDSLPAIKNALRLHSVLDYYDRKKVKKYGDESAATLYQATGDAASSTGNVKVVDQDDKNYGFSAATPGARICTVTKEVETHPFKFAILEVTAPIEFDGLFDTPSTANLTRLLERAGCKVFAALAAKSGVLKTYEAAMDTGLTLFAPNDDAFLAKDAPDVKSMSSANLTKLLQYHALPAYNTKTSLKFLKGSIRTLATGKDAVTVVAKGDDVALDTGKSKSRVADTVVDSVPFCLLTVDSLLVPPELYVGAPEAAPLPSPAEAPSPHATETVDAPSVPADHAADHKTKKASSAVASRPIGAFAAAAAACSVVLASLL